MSDSSLVAPFNPAERFLIPKPEALRSKLQKLVADGPSRLSLISDFDQTLSKYYSKGKAGQCTFDIVHEWEHFAPEFQLEMERLYRVHGPVERDPAASIEEKFAHLEAWRTSTYEQFLKLDIHKSILPAMVLNSSLQLRHGIAELLRLCRSSHVPVTIISAGLGNFINHMLALSASFDGVRVLSNFMLFDEEGKLSGFSKPWIYSQNKEMPLRGEVLPPNVIVLGDMPKDLEVVKSAEYEEALCIGFLNHTEAGSLEDYLSRYDMLILNDGNLDIVADILAAVAGAKSLDAVWLKLESTIDN